MNILECNGRFHVARLHATDPTISFFRTEITDYIKTLPGKLSSDYFYYNLPDYMYVFFFDIEDYNSPYNPIFRFVEIPPETFYYYDNTRMQTFNSTYEELLRYA